MKRYVIPDGWNKFDVKPMNGQWVYCMFADGFINTTRFKSDDPSWEQKARNWTCWKLVEPLQHDCVSSKADQLKMSDWITDRAPTEEDSVNGYIMIWSQCYREAWLIKACNWHSAPWMPIPKPKPYVAYLPKFIVRNDAFNAGKWTVLYDGMSVAENIPTREAAERIAAIYNEVMK